MDKRCTRLVISYFKPDLRLTSLQKRRVHLHSSYM